MISCAYRPSAHGRNPLVAMRVKLIINISHKAHRGHRGKLVTSKLSAIHPVYFNLKGLRLVRYGNLATLEPTFLGGTSSEVLLIL